MRSAYICRTIAVLLAVWCLASCAQQVGDIDRTQPDRIEKSQFEGEWYVRHTLVEVPPSAAFAVAGNQSLTDRIVWEIQKDFLIGRRAHEYRANSEKDRQTNYVQGENGELVPQFEGAPIVAYRILSHFDIQRQYNASTGEPSNVISENASDRPWNERDYMRIDWSKNLATDFFFLDDTSAKVSSVGYFVSETDTDNPDRPLFLEDYMEVTGRLSIEPDFYNLGGGDRIPECFISLGTDCKENIVKTRTSFMKRTADTDMYVQREWDQTDRSKFQIIQWFRPSNSDDYGQNQATTQWVPRIYNLFDDMRKPLEERKLRPITFYLNANWPREDEAVMWATRKTFTDWNEAFQTVLRNMGHPDADQNMIVLCENNPVKASDPRECRERVVHKYDDDGNPQRIVQQIQDITHKGHISWGDVRFNQLNMIMEPQNYGSVLAFAQHSWEQTTGNVLTSSTHVLWTTQESYNTRIADWVQLMNGDLSMEDYLVGNYIRQRIASDEDIQHARTVSSALTDAATPAVQGQALPPQIDMEKVQALRSDIRSMIQNMPDPARVQLKMAEKIERQRDHGGTAVFAERVEKLSPVLRELEMRLKEELIAENKIRPEEFQLTEDVFEQWLPFTARGKEHNHDKDAEWHASRHMLDAENVYGMGQVAYYMPLIERFKGKSREELEAYLRPILYYYTISHEIGHNLGLEHNFAGSNDALNFPIEYWLERAQAGFIPDYLIEDPELRRSLDTNQLLRSSQYTSIMEYLPYDFLRDDEGRGRSGVGTEDLAAIHYAYADMVQVFDEEAVPDTWDWTDNSGQSRSFPVDKSVLEFDPDVARKVEEYHYSAYPNFVLKPEHEIRICMSPIGHLCEEQLPGVDFNNPESDGVYVGTEKLTTENSEDLGNVIFSAAVAMSQGRRWVKADQVESEELIEVPYRTCENARNKRTYYCELHDFGVDLWERTHNRIQAADFYYLIGHTGRDQDTLYTPTYYALRSAENELGPLMDYNKHFINRALIEDKEYFNLWYIDPAGGLDALLAGMDILGHWQNFMARPTMNDREFRQLHLRDPDTGELSSEPLEDNKNASLIDGYAERAVYQLDRETMTMKPLDRFNESSLDASMSMTLSPLEARYTRSEYDPSLGYNYYYRPVVYGNWISKLVAVEMAADPSTNFIGTDTGADTAYALNLGTLFGHEIWGTMAGYSNEIPAWYSHGVNINSEKPQMLDLHAPVSQLLSRFPAPQHEVYLEPDESFTAQLFATVYSTFLFDLGADNPYADASNVQIVGEDRAIPEDAVEGEDYLKVHDFSNEQEFIVFKHQRQDGLFIQRTLASPTWALAERVLDLYNTYDFHDLESYTQALREAQRGLTGSAADAVEDEYRRARRRVEDDLRQLNTIRASLYRFNNRYPNP